VRVVPPVADPEAELARLRRPTGPWLHLLDAAPADARQLGWMLGQDGVVVRILRGHCGRSTYGFLDEVGAALQLPGDPAEDWPALGALLTDMAWLPGAGHVLVVTRASLLLAAEPVRELSGLVEAVREVARGRAEEGDPVPFHVVLQDDAVGIATLRQRLGSVGAKHADLSGWDAEEPVAEVVAGRRSVFVPGTARPDEVDLAAGVAASEVDGVVSMGRAWEEFRGGAGVVRVFAPVLTEPRRAAHAAAAIARAAAELGASCVVVPVSTDADAHDPRQAAVAAAGSVVWPVPDVAEPEPPAAPEPPAEPPESRLPPEPAEPPEPPEPRPPAEPPEPPEPPAPRPPAEPRAAEPPEPPPPEPPPARPTPSEVPGRREPVAGAPPPPVDEQRPGDPPEGEFELVAADLQWDFDAGDPEPDPVDAAVVAHARAGGRTTALFRTWVRDPDDGWVRVVLGYVGPRGSIAEVEGERTAVVEALQRAGAVRCCVEVLAASDVGDAHRWLEERCHRLHPAAPSEPSDAPAPAELPADVPLTEGPSAQDERVAPLVDWATHQTAVIALVTAWAGADGDRTLVVGLAVDAAVEPGPVRAAAAGLSPGSRIEVFAPSRGLSPAQLRLTRTGTRVWQRRTERAAPKQQPASHTDALARPEAPKVVPLGPLPVRDTDEPRGDIQLAGFTLVGIDRQTELGKGAPHPDERDAALVEWAGAEPAVIALLRAVAIVGEETIPVYCACVPPEADSEGVRRELAAAVAATGIVKAAAEAFAPAGAISAFHLDLAVGSTRLWPVTS
jgi:hypothetical protein